MGHLKILMDIATVTLLPVLGFLFKLEASVAFSPLVQVLARWPFSTTGTTCTTNISETEIGKSGFAAEQQ